MSPKAKPTLVRVGKHHIDPLDVAAITEIPDRKPRLYVVRLKSQPNMQYPIWVDGRQVGALLEQFNIVNADEE